MRIGDAGQRRQKLIFRFHDVQIGFEMRREFANDRRFFVLPQQAVVDQDARQLRANRLGQQRRHDRGIDAAGQAANDAAIANSLAQFADRLLGEIVQLPRAVAAADVRQEIRQDRFARRRVRDFRMKLQAVNRQPLVLDRRDRASRRAGQRLEIVGDTSSPDRRGSSTLRSAPARRRTVHRPVPSFEMIVQCARPNSRAGALCTLPPKRLADQLHAVANAQHRNAELKQFRIAMRRARFIHAGRAAGKNQPLGRNFAHPRRRNIVPHDFAINILLPHPPGNQLRILRAEIEHQHFFIGDAGKFSDRQLWP